MADFNEKALHVGLQIEAVEEAARRIAPFVRKTPVVRNDGLDRLGGGSFFFKCENLQVSGAFKARGAFNAVFSLSEEQVKNGVVTHSSGNHAGALALAAAARGVPAYVVMPENAPRTKAANVETAGARIVWCEPNMRSREREARRLQDETGATLIHPYNDYRVMAGQGTVALELLEEQPELDVVFVPISGGGLLSGIAVALKARRPVCRIVGVEPEGADDAARSFRAKRLISIEHPETVADGLRASSLGSRTFPIITSLVDDVVTVSEEAIVRAREALSGNLQMPVEPSGAVAFAAAMTGGGPEEWGGRTVGILVTGGNVD